MSFLQKIRDVIRKAYIYIVLYINNMNVKPRKTRLKPIMWVVIIGVPILTLVVPLAGLEIFSHFYIKW